MKTVLRIFKHSWFHVSVLVRASARINSSRFGLLRERSLASSKALYTMHHFRRAQRIYVPNGRENFTNRQSNLNSFCTSENYIHFENRHTKSYVPYEQIVFNRQPPGGCPGNRAACIEYTALNEAIRKLLKTSKSCWKTNNYDSMRISIGCTINM